MSNSFATLWTVAHRICCPWDFPGENIGVGCHFLLQGIFLTQGLNSRLLPASLALQADSLALSHQVSLSSCRRTQICVSEGHVHPLGRSWVSASYCTVCVQLCPAVLWLHGLKPARFLCPWDSPGKNSGVDGHFQSRASSRPRDQIHTSCSFCFGRQILYHERHLGSPGLWFIAALLFLDCFSLGSAFRHYSELFEYALWNSGKAYKGKIFVPRKAPWSSAEF